MCWSRARSDEQKEQRISAIIDSTAELYKTNSFEDITFALIAKKADFTRSNLYKYFSNKEEIFLSMLTRDVSNWRDAVLKALSEFSEISVSQFTDIWTEVFNRQKRMLDIFTILFTFLEKNASVESIMCFKKSIVEHIGDIAQRMSEIFPDMTKESAGRFIHLQLALSVGFYPMCHLSDKQLTAIERAELDYSPPEFTPNFKLAIESFLKGLM